VISVVLLFQHQQGAAQQRVGCGAFGQPAHRPSSRHCRSRLVEASDRRKSPSTRFWAKATVWTEPAACNGPLHCATKLETVDVSERLSLRTRAPSLSIAAQPQPGPGAYENGRDWAGSVAALPFQLQASWALSSASTRLCRPLPSGRGRWEFAMWRASARAVHGPTLRIVEAWVPEGPSTPPLRCAVNYSPGLEARRGCHQPVMSPARDRDGQL